MVKVLGITPDQTFLDAVLNPNIAYSEGMDQATYETLIGGCENLIGNTGAYEACLSEASSYWTSQPVLGMVAEPGRVP